MIAEWPGYCPTCESLTTFDQHGDWLRDELVCRTCASNPRMRAIPYVLSLLRPDWRHLRLWELAPAGPMSDRFRRECSLYTGTQYWPDVEPGSYREGVRCEDVERPTFDTGSFDVVIASDVFEHVFDIDGALREIARVLASDGLFVWTVPQIRTLEVSRARARRAGGDVEHMLPPEYHGDPVNADGVLVTYDWGQDLPTRVAAASGMRTSVFRLESRQLGILGEFTEVFVSTASDDLRTPVRDRSEEDRPASTDSLWARLKTSEQSAASYRDEVRALRASTSWRVTRPLRAVSGLIRRSSSR